MKKGLFYCLLLILTGCHKLERYLGHKEPEQKECSISEHSLLFLGDAYSPRDTLTHFKKTYYPDGRPEKLYAVLRGNFGQIDTLEYYFTHAANRVDIRLYAHGEENYNNPYPPDTTSFSAAFDPSSGYVTQIGDDKFIYENGKLIQAANHLLEYDSHGNLIFVGQLAAINPDNTAGLYYEYDSTRKAGKNDFYKPAGLMFLRNYCLAEIMGWLPPMAQHIRTKEVLYLGKGDKPENDVIGQTYLFENHQYNADSVLTSVAFNGLETHSSFNCKTKN